MFKTKIIQSFCFVLIVLASLFSSSVIAADLTTTRLSNHLGDALISADSRYIVFSEYNRTRSFWYVFDRATTKKTLIRGADFVFGISGNGKYVAFNSYDSTLVAGDTNNLRDVFVLNRQNQQITRVNVSSAGLEATDYSYGSSISADGRYIAFNSIATNLVPGDNNNHWDSFVHDIKTNQTKLISVQSNGTQGNKDSSGALLSSDGRYVAFTSRSDLDPNPNVYRYNQNDVYVHDLLYKTTTQVSVSSTGIKGIGNSYLTSISADGRFVGFNSEAGNLAVISGGNHTNTYVHDRLTHQTSIVNFSTDGTPGKRRGYNSELSANGRLVFYESHSTAGRSIQLYDRMTNQTSAELIIKDGSNAQYNDIFEAISADGRNFIYSRSDDGTDPAALGVYWVDRSLDTNSQADLKISATNMPISLAAGRQGSFTYTITNLGASPVPTVSVTHLISNGKLAKFVPSQGSCNNYAAISLCELGSLAKGQSLTLKVNAISDGDVLSQSISVSGSPVDTKLANNFITVDTPVN